MREEQIRTAVCNTKPLVQCITNFVSMDIMANVLLAVGASPAMVHSADEVSAGAALGLAHHYQLFTILPWLFVSANHIHHCFK